MTDERGHGSRCKTPGKHPLVKWTPFQKRPPTEEEVRFWWTHKWPQANLMTITNAHYGRMVLDPDGPEGEETLAALERQYGELPETQEVLTRRGRHLHFKHPGVPIPNSAGELGLHLDVRGDEGLAVLPPSTNRGVLYAWEVEHRIFERPLAELPEAWLQLITRTAANKRRKGKGSPLPAAIPEGQRNSVMLSLAGAARRRGASEQGIFALLVTENAERCDPPLDEDELAGIAASAARYEPAASVVSLSVPVTPAQPSANGHHTNTNGTGAAPPPPGADGTATGTAAAATQTGPDDRGVIRRLAEAISAGDRFAQDAGGRLYRYAGGVYRPDGAETVKRLVKVLLEAWAEDKRWTGHRADDVVEYIRLDAPALWECPPLDVVNVRNGLLNVVTRELVPHSPDHLSPIQLPVTYDKLATCPAWDTFLSEVVDADTIPACWEVVAWLMTPDTSIQKAILLLGEGSNGKSVFITAVTALIGKYNIAGLQLHRLEQDKFSVARLVGKLANLCADLPSAHLDTTSTFKALTGGDVMLGERKYADSFEFTPFARLVFSANQPPRSTDATHAFFRRWEVLPFTRTFEEREQVPRAVLDARLANPAELSGALNRALDALTVLRQQNGFTVSPAMREAWDEFRQSTDPLAVWLERSTVRNAAALVIKRELLKAYNLDCQQHGRAPMTAHGFTAAIRRLYPEITETQRTISGKVEWVWTGIGVKEADYAP